MKKLLILSLIFMAISATYVALKIQKELPLLTEAVSFKPGSDGYEIEAGCVGYYQIAQRWPRNERELKAGLEHLKIKPEKIGTLKSLQFSNKDGATLIRFTTAQGMNCVLENSRPTIEEHNTDT